VKPCVRPVHLTLLVALVVVCSRSAGCALSDRIAVEGLDDRGLLVVQPPRKGGDDLRAPTHEGFEVLDEMGQVVRWTSGAWGARVSVLLRPGIYEVRTQRRSPRGAFAHVRAGEVTRVVLRGAGGVPAAGASARSEEARGGP